MPALAYALPLPWDVYEGDAVSEPPSPSLTASASRPCPGEPSPVTPLSSTAEHQANRDTGLEDDGSTPSGCANLIDLKVLQEMFYELLCDHVILLSKITDAGIRKDSEIQRVFRVIAEQV